ncbi:MAG: hypothetical protein M1826_007047 [Phylliscum demangeonii]|nr:MAG: hypothetical protein M1826_007047 [Phylliscum demangeonii]
MRCSYPLAFAVWLATALALPSSPSPSPPGTEPGAEPAPAQGKPIDVKKWGGAVGGVLAAAGLLGLAGMEHEGDLVQLIGADYAHKLSGLDTILDKQTRPKAYRCMRSCIIREFEFMHVHDPHRMYPMKLGAAYVPCQQSDRCNLDPADRINPYSYKKRYPRPAQEEGQRRNVNRFELLAGRVSHGAHRFAAQAGRTWRAVEREGGRLESALEKDKVLQFARHEG